MQSSTWRQVSLPRVASLSFKNLHVSLLQKVIAKYYRKESKLDDGPFADPLQKSRPYMLLRPQFWRGQQRGMNRGHPYLSSLAVHTRHMRPMCESISSGLSIVHLTVQRLESYIRL